MRIRRSLRSIWAFLTQLGIALFKAAVVSMILGGVVVSIMHYMGVPVPSPNDLMRELAHIFS